jgi:hypothetical protein
MYNFSIFLIIFSCCALIASVVCLYLIVTYKKNKKQKNYIDPFTKDYCKDGCVDGVCTQECIYGEECCKSNKDCLNCKDRNSGIYYSKKLKTPSTSGLDTEEENKIIKLQNKKTHTLNEDIDANNKYIEKRNQWIKYH